MAGKIATAVLALVAVAAPAASVPCPGGLTIDLGYGVYQGVLDNTTGLESWKGIRYAAAPVGSLRWQAPQPPPVNRTLVVADAYAPSCAQALDAGIIYPLFPGSEDCLFVNVWRPSPGPGRNCLAPGLPVMVYIHGGGYGLGNGAVDMTTFLNSTRADMVIVAFQYRLGAFGFLSSEEVKRRGVLNAGLHDMKFALDWVQKHVAKFGGNPAQVTILGESAGGGAGVLLSMAENGTWGTSRFQGIVASSPYLPTQPSYNDDIPTRRYYELAAAVGCPSSGQVFDCLVAANFSILQDANYNFTNTHADVPYGNWAFIPVTDGSFLVDRPSRQLAAKRVNGRRVLTSNNADEGPAFMPFNITTQAALVKQLHTVYPNLTASDINALLVAYPSPDVPDDANAPKFATNGLGPATMVNVSQVATGHQQRAFAMYMESTFACPSYWLASAFVGDGKVSYRYQYSVPYALHASDWYSLFGPPAANQPPEFNLAFRLVIVNFIAAGNPSIPVQVANGASSPNPNAPNPAANWPVWSGGENQVQLVLNTTGGRPYVTQSPVGAGPLVTQFEQPGLLNRITAANAYAWEGGRGARCAVWKALGPRVPE